MDKELENKMLLDGYWESNEKECETWEMFCKQADEQYDEAVSEWQS